MPPRKRGRNSVIPPQVLDERSVEDTEGEDEDTEDVADSGQEVGDTTEPAVEENADDSPGPSPYMTLTDEVRRSIIVGRVAQLEQEHYRQAMLEAEATKFEDEAGAEECAKVMMRLQARIDYYRELIG